ncbi:MAG: choloylglycine hydrolase [Clostridia bacterium]|nr:choloylglycine hydrolase [Clostridia bacterium]
MCTAISFNAKGHFFGRTLDLERRFGECVTITPRNYVFKFKTGEVIKNHHAIIGMAAIVEDYPLYFDATNEHGLSIAGLNFVGNAYYGKANEQKINLAPYELIPYLLSKYKCVDECICALKEINLVDAQFNKNLENGQLHWLISDKNKSIVVECMRDGTKIHQNPVGVLTNNPPFEYQMMNLNNYMGLSNIDPQNKFSDKIILKKYSRGMGALGLPGDFSSASRFVRVAFAKLNSVNPLSENESISQFFHILGTVEQVEGCVIFDNRFERTQYTSCCDTERGIYYYKTYENSQISAINMYRENLDIHNLICYDLIFTEQIKYINRRE